MSTRCISWW